MGREAILGFFSPFIQSYIWLKEKEWKEEEKEERRREVQEIQVWNISFCMELMFGNTCLSWVRKTLTLQYMYILVSLSQFCSFVLKWFDLVKRFPVKMAKTGHLCFQHDTPMPRRTRGRVFLIF